MGRILSLHSDAFLGLLLLLAIAIAATQGVFGECRLLILLLSPQKFRCLESPFICPANRERRKRVGACDSQSTTMGSFFDTAGFG